MRIISVLIILFSLLSLTACAIPKGSSPEDVERKKADFEKLITSRTVTVLNQPYLGARAVPLPKNSELSSGVFSRQITLNKYGTMTELAATVSSMLKLPIVVNGSGVRGSAATLPSGAALDAELNAALGAQASPGGTFPGAAPAVTSRSSGGFRVNYSGTVKGLLDMLAARSGLSWDYNPDSGIVFDSANIKTFTLWAAPGKIKFSNKITNESNASGGSSGESRQDSSIQTAQTNTTELEFDIWKDVEAEVKSLLSSSGSVSVNQAAGTITVKDSPYSIKQVSKYVDDLNEKLSRQIALSVKVWSLEIVDPEKGATIPVNKIDRARRNASRDLFAAAAKRRMEPAGFLSVYENR